MNWKKLGCLLLLLLCLSCGSVKAEEVLDVSLEDYIDLDSIEAGLQELTALESFSFRDTVMGLIRGEIPLEPSKLPGMAAELFLEELRQQKTLALQILLIVLTSAVFTNFVHVFENNQIADISFFMMYLLISTLLVRSFAAMNAMVLETCSDMGDFMKLLLPPYLITIVLSSGSLSAIGFYEIILLALQLLQGVLVNIVLPAINFYLVLLILNQMTREDYFSRFAKLLETIIEWSVKTMLGIVAGLQVVQGLIAPAVDSLKSSSLHRLAKTIPGVGSVLDSVAETMAGSALVIKNAVGVAGMVALVVICSIPFLKLAACILLFRLLCAFIQPFSEKRMVEGIESISHGTVLLMRVLSAIEECI